MTKEQETRLMAALDHPGHTLPVLRNLVRSLMAGMLPDIAEYWITVAANWNTKEPWPASVEGDEK